MKKAKGICRQLGFREKLGDPSNDEVRKTRVEKLDIDCEGHENTIGDCHVTHTGWVCTGDGVVGAYCSTTYAEDTTADAR